MSGAEQPSTHDVVLTLHRTLIHIRNLAWYEDGSELDAATRLRKIGSFADVLHNLPLVCDENPGKPLFDYECRFVQHVTQKA